MRSNRTNVNEDVVPIYVISRTMLARPTEYWYILSLLIPKDYHIMLWYLVNRNLTQPWPVNCRYCLISIWRTCSISVERLLFCRLYLMKTRSFWEPIRYYNHCYIWLLNDSIICQAELDRAWAENRNNAAELFRTQVRSNITYEIDDRSLSGRIILASHLYYSTKIFYTFIAFRFLSL